MSGELRAARVHAFASWRLGHLAVAAAALGAAWLLAAHHPLWPRAATAALLLWCGAAWRFPRLWLFVAPAALPVANLAPWTGWIGLEELDLLLLGTAAAGHLRLARAAPMPPSSPLARAAGLALLAVGVLGLLRGVQDAGSWSFDWFDGYTAPLNSVRVFKPLLHVLLLWPLVRHAVLADADRAAGLFARGMLAGLVAFVAAVLWERAAFPGLFDFSAPYRTTALFWEMHVGGAAIDAYVVLGAPFVGWALWAARRPAQWAAAAVLALLVAYACLTTFSRGVYAATAVPLLLLGLWLWSHRSDGEPMRSRHVAAIGLMAVCGMALGFAWLGTTGAAVALVVFLAAFLVMQRAGRLGWRSAAALMLTIGLAFEALAVFGPDSFMRKRLHVVDLDSSSRLQHWARGLSLPKGDDWLWGLGLGRLPSHYAARGGRGQFSGAARLAERREGGHAARVTGPASSRRLGGQFGLTQWVALEPTYRVQLDVHVAAFTELYLHVCERHLLYEGRCQWAFVPVWPGDGGWHRIDIPLRGPPLTAGAWYAPRRAAFTVSVVTPGGSIEVDNVVLRSAEGNDLLANGGFEQGFARWLPSAQGWYVPWHIDNLYLELLIERGIAGAAIVLGALGWVLYRLLASARRNPMAPFLAASLVGALCLGLVSSLLDVPRVAFLLGLIAVLGYELSPDAGPLSSRD